MRSQQGFRSDHHKVYTEEINKITLSSNDDKRIQSFDKVTTYPYGTDIFMLNSDSQALRDKSLLLRNEAQALRNNSLILRNELKELRAVSNDIKTKSCILRAELQMLRNKSNDSQALRDKSLLLRNEAQARRNNSLILRNELKEIRAVSHDVKTKSRMHITELQMLRNKSVKSEIGIIIDGSKSLEKNLKIPEKNLIKLLLVHESLEKN